MTDAPPRATFDAPAPSAPDPAAGRGYLAESFGTRADEVGDPLRPADVSPPPEPSDDPFSDAGEEEAPGSSPA